MIKKICPNEFFSKVAAIDRPAEADISRKKIQKFLDANFFNRIFSFFYFGFLQNKKFKNIDLKKFGSKNFILIAPLFVPPEIIKISERNSKILRAKLFLSKIFLLLFELFQKISKKISKSWNQKKISEKNFNCYGQNNAFGA